MKRIRTIGVSLLLIAMLLTGCSVESLTEKGVGLLNQIMGGDPDEPRMSVQSDAPSTSKPAADPEPAAQEPSLPVQGVEPTIPSQTSDEPQLPDSTPTVSDVAAVPSIQNITPSHTDATFFGPGESFKYLPKGVDGIYACTYASEDETIATVDSNTGKVTAVGPGTTKVTMHVECSGQYDFECIVRCNWKDDDKQPVLPAGTAEPSLPAASGTSGISASHSDATFFNPKEHFKFLPVGAGAGYTCTYKTDDAKVASVDEKGVVTAVGPGTTTVTMTVDGGGTEYIFECIVRCKWSE